MVSAIFYTEKKGFAAFVLNVFESKITGQQKYTEWKVRTQECPLLVLSHLSHSDKESEGE